MIAPNTRLGNYIVRGPLGEGGMAQVYAAEELLSRRAVALKVLRPEFGSSARGRQRFINEMAILTRLDDPHIVRCLSCVDVEGQLVMVLERLEGFTLRAMLEARGRLPAAEAVGYAMQMARALHAAHSGAPPIIHRDLKPENVMCLPDGRAKVMDFGIAKVLQDMAGATREPIGTMQYMSPEHIDSRPLDGRADLFALGLVLWEMLAGRPPFHSQSPRELLDQICVQPTPPLPRQVRAEVPQGLEALLGRLLAKDRDERPASAVALIRELAPFAQTHGGAPRSTSAPRPPPPPPRPPRKSPPPGEAEPPNLDTASIVAEAGKGPVRRQVEEQLGAHYDQAVEAASRFARATSAWIVRALVSLMILPAGALLFVGAPLVITVFGMALLMRDGLDLETLDTAASAQATDGVCALAVLVAVFVFMRTSWTHRREPSEGRGLIRAWLIVGVLPMLGWVATIALELSPESSLSPTIHDVAMTAAFAWMTITMSGVVGRLASRILRRL